MNFNATLSQTLNKGSVDVSLSSLFRLGDTSFILASGEIYSVEHIEDIDIDHHKEDLAIGSISLRGNDWPVYCLDDDLTLISDITTDRNICTMLRMGDALFGVLCNSLNPVRFSEKQIQPVPESMVNPDAPFDAIVVLDDNSIALHTSAEKLHTLIYHEPIL